MTVYVGVGSGATAAAAIVSRGLMAPGLVPANRTEYRTNNGANNQSNGTDVAAMSRIRHKALFSTGYVRPLYLNTRFGKPGQQANAITIKGGMENPDGGILPVTFGGARSKYIDIDGVALGDPVAVGQRAGDFVYSRTFVEARDSAGSLITSGKWPLLITTTAVKGEGVESAASGITDKTASGTITASGAYAFGPVALLACNPDGRLVFGFTGDSIMEAAGQALGFPEFFAGDTPMLNLGAYGDAASNNVGATNAFMVREFLLSCCDVILNGYGSNDLNGGATVAALQATDLALAARLSATGARVAGMTVLPRPSASSDSWVTLAGQTLPTWEALRVSFNAWKRAGCPVDPNSYAAVAVGTSGALTCDAYTAAGVKTLSGTGHPYYTLVIDAAGAVESSADSGKWTARTVAQSAITLDGAHLAPYGLELVAAAMMAAFTTASLAPTLTFPPTLAAPVGPASTYRAALLARSPIAYWRLGEKRGRYMYDQMARHGAELRGGATLGVAGALTDADTALSFDGSTGYIEAQDSEDWRRISTFTLSCWVKTSTLTGNIILVSGPMGGGFTWRTVSGNGFQNLLIAGTNEFDNAGGGVLPTNAWTHLAVSYAANGDVRFYVNGAATSSTNNKTPPTTQPTSTSPLRIGADTNATPAVSIAAMVLDDVAIFGSVLSPAMIAADYAAR